MKTRATRIWIAAVALSGRAAMTIAQQPVAPVAPAAPAVAAQAPAIPVHNNVKPAMKWKRFDYTCEGGTKLTVYLRGETAKVRLGDRQYLMTQTPSADGNRYSNGKVAWWGKGDGGFLQEDTPDDDGKMIVKDCKLEKPAKAPEPKKP